MQIALNYRTQLLIVRQSMNWNSHLKIVFFLPEQRKVLEYLQRYTLYLDFLNNENVICGKK